MFRISLYIYIALALFPLQKQYISKNCLDGQHNFLQKQQACHYVLADEVVQVGEAVVDERRGEPVQRHDEHVHAEFTIPEYAYDCGARALSQPLLRIFMTDLVKKSPFLQLLYQFLDHKTGQIFYSTAYVTHRIDQSIIYQ